MIRRKETDLRVTKLKKARVVENAFGEVDDWLATGIVCNSSKVLHVGPIEDNPEGQL